MKKTKKSEILFMRHARQMFNICLRITANKQDAEDILQEAFIKAYTKYDSLKSEAAFYTWLRRIVINEAISFKRGKIYFPETDLAGIEQDDDDEWNYSNISFDTINEEIKKLPDGARLVFNLHLLENYSHKEIAQMLEISESTSKSQYHRAKKLLKKNLKEKYLIENEF